MKKLLLIALLGLSLFGSEFDDSVKKTIEGISKSMPLDLGKGIKWTKYTLEDKKVYMEFKVPSENLFKESEDLIRQACDNGATKELIKNGYTTETKYFNSKNELLKTITINSDICTIKQKD